jgi:hypothetical protein
MKSSSELAKPSRLVALVLPLLVHFRNSRAAATSVTTPRGTPTPIPAFWPVDRPPEDAARRVGPDTELPDA